MNIRALTSLAAVSAVLAVAGASVSISSPAHAQQAKAQKPPAMDKVPGKMPVTPFGPRTRPPARGQRRGAPAAPKPEVLMKEGMWRVLCEKLPVAKDKTRKTCYVSATATDPKRKGVFISLIVLKVKQGKKSGYMMNVRAPIGVYLPTGIALEIDGKAVARVPFIRCNPLFCESLAAPRPQTLKDLKKGKKAKFIVYAAPGQGLPLTFELKGFTAVMKKLDSIKQ